MTEAEAKLLNKGDKIKCVSWHTPSEYFTNGKIYEVLEPFNNWCFFITCDKATIFHLTAIENFEVLQPASQKPSLINCVGRRFRLKKQLEFRKVKRDDKALNGAYAHNREYYLMIYHIHKREAEMVNVLNNNISFGITEKFEITDFWDYFELIDEPTACVTNTSDTIPECKCDLVNTDFVHDKNCEYMLYNQTKLKRRGILI